MIKEETSNSKLVICRMLLQAFWIILQEKGFRNINTTLNETSSWFHGYSSPSRFSCFCSVWLWSWVMWNEITSKSFPLPLSDYQASCSVVHFPHCKVATEKGHSIQHQHQHHPQQKRISISISISMIIKITPVDRASHILPPAVAELFQTWPFWIWTTLQTKL